MRVTLEQLERSGLTVNAKLLAVLLIKKRLFKIEVLKNSYFILRDTVGQFCPFSENQIEPYRIELLKWIGKYCEPTKTWDDYVYVVFDPKNCLYKIGFSRTPRIRFKQISRQKKGCIPLMLIHADDVTESILHGMFFDKLTGHEWFKLNTDDMNNLKQICKPFMAYQEPFPRCFSEIGIRIFQSSVL